MKANKIYLSRVKNRKKRRPVKNLFIFDPNNPGNIIDIKNINSETINNFNRKNTFTCKLSQF